jgi:hypothetical protein
MVSSAVPSSSCGRLATQVALGWFALINAACYPDYTFDWWDVRFGGRVPLRVGAADETLTDVPVLVTLDDTRIDYGATQDGGQDVRFVTDNGHVLPHEIERWDETGTSSVWFELPSLPDGAETLVWLYFGAPSIEDGQRPQDMWQAYAGVYHLSDQLGPGSTVRDSTSGAHHGAAASNMDTSNMAAGRVAGSIELPGLDVDSPHVAVPVTPSFHVPRQEARSMELWSRIEETAHAVVLLGDEECCVGWNLALPFPRVARLSLGKNNCCFGPSQELVYDSASLELPPPSGQGFFYLAGVIDRTAGVITAYLDGERQAETPIENDVDGGGDLYIGSRVGASAGLGGRIDEVRIGKAAFSPAWFAFQFRSMSDRAIEYAPLQRR